MLLLLLRLLALLEPEQTGRRRAEHVLLLLGRRPGAAQPVAARQARVGRVVAGHHAGRVHALHVLLVVQRVRRQELAGRGEQLPVRVVDLLLVGAARPVVRRLAERAAVGTAHAAARRVVVVVRRVLRPLLLVGRGARRDARQAGRVSRGVPCARPLGAGEPAHELLLVLDHHRVRVLDGGGGRRVMALRSRVRSARPVVSVRVAEVLVRRHLMVVRMRLGSVVQVGRGAGRRHGLAGEDRMVRVRALRLAHAGVVSGVMVRRREHETVVQRYHSVLSHSDQLTAMSPGKFDGKRGSRLSRSLAVDHWKHTVRAQLRLTVRQLKKN